MKVTNFEDRIHVIDTDSDVTSVIKGIVEPNVQEDAFYVCDVGDMVAKHQTWKAHMPRVEPHYAVKCNDSPIVLSTLASLGLGFDCASKGEIAKVLKLGVEPSRIIFANPAKPSSHIRYASATDVKMMTFDSASELQKVKKLYPDAKMVLRIRYDAEIAQCSFGMKFGCDPVTEGPKLLQVAHSMGITVIGVSFHVGSGCGDPPVFYKAISAARKLFDYAEMELGYKMTLLDIGGGYPGDHGTSIDKIAHHVNTALNDFFPDEAAVRVISEPGRFFVASAYTLVCNVYATRSIANGNANANGNQAADSHTMYFINDGVYGSFNCMLYEDRKVTPILLKSNSSGAEYPSSIWGPTCDGIDVIARSVMLPEINIGDWIVFEDMGAYTLSAASPFNGFPIPKVHLIVDQATWYFLRDEVCLTSDHFALGDDYIRLGLDDDFGGKPWTIPELPMSIPCYDININGEEFQQHVLDFAKP